MKKSNHKADIKNANKGTTGINQAYKAAQLNRQNQLNEKKETPQDFIDESEYLDEGYFAFDD